MSFKKSLADYVRLEEAKVAQGTGLMVGVVLAAVVLGHSSDTDAATHIDSHTDSTCHSNHVSHHLNTNCHVDMHTDMWC